MDARLVAILNLSNERKPDVVSENAIRLGVAAIDDLAWCDELYSLLMQRGQSIGFHPSTNLQYALNAVAYRKVNIVKAWLCAELDKLHATDSPETLLCLAKGVCVKYLACSELFNFFDVALWPVYRAYQIKRFSPKFIVVSKLRSFLQDFEHLCLVKTDITLYLEKYGDPFAK